MHGTVNIKYSVNHCTLTGYMEDVNAELCSFCHSVIHYTSTL